MDLLNAVQTGYHASDVRALIFANRIEKIILEEQYIHLFSHNGAKRNLVQSLAYSRLGNNLDKFGVLNKVKHHIKRSSFFQENFASMNYLYLDFLQFATTKEYLSDFLIDPKVN